MINKWEYKTSGIDDNLFIRGKVPMTKSEVRAVSLSKLKLKDGLKVLDIGAGTGSISIECAKYGCLVVAIEKNEEGVELISLNSQHFQVNVEVIKGIAPTDVPKNVMFQRVFIGGSGKKLCDIFKYLETSLDKDGILVANTITIENTSKILELMAEYKYIDIEAVTLNVSRSKKVGSIHMMLAENPITIISGRKRR